MSRKPAAQLCPNEAGHTPQPRGYVAWHEWAEKMAETHKQERCPSCGLWEVWVPKGHGVSRGGGSR
jgi:hypothetical protein